MKTLGPAWTREKGSSVPYKLGQGKALDDCPEGRTVKKVAQYLTNWDKPTEQTHGFRRAVKKVAQYLTNWDRIDMANLSPLLL